MSWDSAFVEPPWGEPLEAERLVAAVPVGATMAGMFFLALQEGAERRQVELAFPRTRYLQFGFYGVREFAQLLVQASGAFYPELPLRQGLRRIGTVGPLAFLASTLGKVTLGATVGVHDAVQAIAKTYAINIRPSRCVVQSSAARRMVVSLDEVHHFLDSHHVGVFEGTLGFAGVQGSVRIQRRSETAADLLLEW